MKTKKLFWGIFFLCAAAAVILNAIGYLANVSLVSVIFTIVLIPIIVKSVARRNYIGIFFPLAVIGILYAKPLNIEAVSPWPLLAAALFLSIAFSILFGKKKGLQFVVHKNISHFDDDDFEGDDKHEKTVVHYDDNEVVCDTSFGACTNYVHCSALKRVKLNCSCGAIKIYFDNAQLDPGGANATVDCTLGSIEMYVPKTWQVYNTVSATLGASEERNKRYEAENGPVMNITGSVSLGSFAIIYV